MNQALARLTKTEEIAILDLAIANNCDIALLRCHMTRQQDSGVSKLGTRVSYNLMLCEHCGHLMPFRVCPAKAQELKRRLLSD